MSQNCHSRCVEPIKKSTDTHNNDNITIIRISNRKKWKYCNKNRRSQSTAYRNEKMIIKHKSNIRLIFLFMVPDLFIFVLLCVCVYACECVCVWMCKSYGWLGKYMPSPENVVCHVKRVRCVVRLPIWRKEKK